MQRFNISMDEELVQRVDAFAAERKQNRSAVIRQALIDYMDAMEKMPTMKMLLAAFAQNSAAVLNGEITQDEYQVRIEDIEQQMQQLKKSEK